MPDEHAPSLSSRAETLIASFADGATPEELAAVEPLFDECETAFATHRATTHAADRSDAAYAMAVVAVGAAPSTSPQLAIVRLDSALVALRSISDVDAEFRCGVALPLARLLTRLGRLDESIAHLDAELPSIGAAPFHAPILHAERATTLRLRGDARGAFEALNHAESALADRDPVAPVEFHAITRCEIEGERGQVFLDLGRADLAARHFEVESELAERTGDLATRFAALLHRIHHDLASEDVMGAIARIDAALENPAFGGALDASSRAMLEVRRASAEVRAAIDDPRLIAEAKRNAFSAAKLGSKGLLSGEDRVIAALDAARAARLAGHRRHARIWLEEAKVALDRLDGLSSTAVLAMFSVAELAFARFTAQGDEETRTGDPLPRARRNLQSMLEEWDAAPRLEAGLGYFHYASRCELVVESIRAVVADDPSREGIREAFELLLQVDARSQLGRGQVATFEGVVDLLHGTDVLLAWVPSPESTQLFVVGRGRLEVVECAGISRLRAAGSALHDALEAGSDVDAAALELFDLAIPEGARAHLRDARRLLLYGIENVGNVPIERAQGSTGAPLGIQYGVTRIPSLAWAVRKSNEPAVARGRDVVRVLAPSISPTLRELRPDLEPLSLDDARFDDFSRLDASARVLTGDAATLDALRAELEQPARLLLFVTHGWFDLADPRPGRLVLAAAPDDALGEFDADAAESLPPCDLVVLAACRSGVGPLRRGDTGAADLVGAFQSGGAKAVIATSTDVHAGPAGDFLLLFERELRVGLSPCEALAAARRELLDPRTRFPRIERERVAWSFRLSGLGHRPLEWSRDPVEWSQADPPPRDRWTSAVIGGVLGVLLGLLIFSRLRTRKGHRSP